MTCLADISIYRQACFGGAIAIAFAMAAWLLITTFADLRTRFLSLPDHSADQLSDRDGGGVGTIHNGRSTNGEATHDCA